MVFRLNIAEPDGLSVVFIGQATIFKPVYGLFLVGSQQIRTQVCYIINLTMVPFHMHPDLFMHSLNLPGSLVFEVNFGHMKT